jgi:rhamnosyl/mannosyltransferase
MGRGWPSIAGRGGFGEATVNVLQVSKFFPPIMGGIESVAWELAEGLHRKGWRTGVLCANRGARTRIDEPPGGYPVVRAGAWTTLLSTSIAPAMLHQMRRLQATADVVHVHMPDPMAAAAVWCCRPDAKLVVHWHSDVIRQRWALKLYEPLQTWLLRRADVIVATSAPYAEASSVLAPWRHKVRVIPIGISDNRSSATAHQVATVRQRYRHRRMVFALGRMTYYKGFDVLIEAAAGLPDDTVVVIGGDGELLDRFQHTVARKGLAGKVHLPGHIDDDWLPSYFAACDVFCMPSTVRAEAYGVAIIEAMIMGKPIVASAIEGSGVPWVNQDGSTGYNVAVGEPAALREGLLRVLSDQALQRRLGEAARQRYVDTFGAQQMIQRMTDLYTDLLAH